MFLKVNRKNLPVNLFLVFVSFVNLFFMTVSSSCKKTNGSGKNKITTLTVVSYGGGAYQESHRLFFCKPFQANTGIRVDSIAWNAEYGKLKAMVESGMVPWDVVEVTEAQFKRGLHENLYEKLAQKPAEKEFIEGTVTDYGVANVYWGTVLAYNKKMFSEQSPESWSDFFNYGKFPGPRALYDDPRGNLEFALLADGVPINNLYPLDVDRAFRFLDKKRHNIKVWWKDSTQPVQLMLTENIAMSTAWNGRIFASEDAKKAIGYIWNGAALELDYWIIPRGSLKVVQASQFISFASSAHALAEQSSAVGYGPVNIASFNFIKQEIQTQLPTYPSNWEKTFVIDSEWWSKNEEKIKTRWLTWKMR